MKLSKTYSLVTPDSRIDGDTEESGFVYECVEYDTIEEIAREILTEGCGEWSSSNPGIGDYFCSEQPSGNLYTGHCTFYAFHPKGLTVEQMDELVKLTK